MALPAHHSSQYLFNACEQGDIELILNHIKSLSSSEICSIRDENQATLVHYACRYGYLNLLKYLFESKQINPSQLRTEHGATCAHDAAVCDQIDILKYIFYQCKQLQWNTRDELGNTPLHLAASYNSHNVLHYLLNQQHADPHNPSYNGFLAIHYASEHGHNECIKLLLTKSPDTVNQQTNQLSTPIHLACQNGFLATVQLLISYGANFQLKDQNGSNCLHMACGNGHIDIVQWLVEKQNVNVNECDYQNCTPLHYAAMNGNEHLINYLLDKQAKITSDSHGNTPLHKAAENGHQSACAILVEGTCSSVNSVNNRQLTAADLAANSDHLSLANELHLRGNSSLLQKATVVRLVIKKRNVQRADVSCQVNEDDFIDQKNHYLPSRKGEISTTMVNSENILHTPRSSVVAIAKLHSDM
ncbi:unnamed protein product [Adineta ricciae]|uniref:Uncharacterized protein n=2 Tax=Adineta ricciae TaxID=249248 RepID=A0A814W9W5_ADIRI|nr:unnamed protein product [Adineta ricciae]CAF1525949.1 unnamed protein product [Adineta ricciae]